MADLGIDPQFAERSVNEGFSGGEKKRHEILQLGLLKPKIAILDETDSGLDVDALRVVSEGVNRYAEAEHAGVLLITHYTRILRYIRPTSSTSSSTAASSSPAARSWPTNSRRTATSGSPSRPQRPGHEMTASVDLDVTDLVKIRADFPILSR
jgi:Fe-S cluster assembly ATP-binding protein